MTTRRNSPRTPRSGVIPLVALFVAVSITVGQDMSRKTPPLRLDADLSRFLGPDSTTFVELSYGLLESALTYRQDSTGFSGVADMRLEIRADGRIVASRNWEIPRVIPESLAHRSAQNILSIETMTLPAGEYAAILFCRDHFDSTRSDSVVLPIRPGIGVRDGVGLSDIELCSRIAPSIDKTSLFYKNTLEVIPNPSRLYGGGLSVLHFYAEVYNLMETGTGEVILRAAILDPSGTILASSAKVKPRANNSSVEYGSMNLASLPGGSYIFRLSVDDSLSTPPRVLVTREKKFFLLQPETEAPTGYPPFGSSGDAYTLLTAKEVDDEIRKIAYIASEPEREQIDDLDDPFARRNYLRKFWGGRGPDGVNGRNDARAAYLRRIAEADEAYTERGRRGWLTDRGRILILYGVPDDIDRHPSESEANPYEIWNYHSLQGGVEFIFVDVLGFGRYRLVHSSHLDELRNENWYIEEAKIR